MAKLVIGTNINNTGTSSVVVEKPVPMPLSMQFRKDENGKLLNPNTIMDLTGITDLDNSALYYSYRNNSYLSGEIDLSSLIRISSTYACYGTFYGCTNITGINLSSLVTISGGYACSSMFYDCSKLVDIKLSSLTTVSGTYAMSNMFDMCQSLKNVDLSTIESIGGNYSFANLFKDCNKLESVDLSSLITIKSFCTCSNMFAFCRKLVNVDLSSLAILDQAEASLGYMFWYCDSLKTLSLPSLTTNSFGTRFKNQFDGMLQSCSNVTIHFPSNLESTIQTLTGYPNFGGTNTVLSFDLPATE